MSKSKHKLDESKQSQRSSFRSSLLKTQYKSRVGQFIKDVWKARDIANINKHFASDFVDHNSWQGSVEDLEGWKNGFANFCDTFPNYKFSLEKIVSEGDIVATKYRIVTGTDEYATISGVDMYRIARGKIIERWGLYLLSIPINHLSTL